MCTLLSNRKLLKRKLVDIENHIRGALRTYGLLVGPISRRRYEARIRELIEHTDIVFKTMIETMLEVRRAIFEGFDKVHRIVCRCSARCGLPAPDDGSGRRTRCRVVIEGGRG